MEDRVVAAQVFVQEEAEDSVLPHLAYQQDLLLLIQLQASWKGQAAQGQRLHLLVVRPNHEDAAQSVLDGGLLEGSGVSEEDVLLIEPFVLVKGPTLMELGPRKAR